MSTEWVLSRVRRMRPAWPVVALAAAAVGAEALVVATYVLVEAGRVTNPLVFVYPFVWMDAAVLAVLAVDSPPASRRGRVLGLGVAAGYLLVLAYVGGLVGAGSGTAALHVDWRLPPGYGPALLYDGPFLRMVLQPYKLVGYLALSYLVYTTVLDAAGGAVAGVVGLFSCVSCSWPVLATVATTVFGGGSAVAGFALGHSYALGTLVYLSAVVLLSYRPLLT